MSCNEPAQISFSLVAKLGCQLLFSLKFVLLQFVEIVSVYWSLCDIILTIKGL